MKLTQIVLLTAITISPLAGILGCQYSSYCNNNKKEIKRVASLSEQEYMNWVHLKIYGNPYLCENDKEDINDIYTNIDINNLTNRDKKFIEIYDKNRKKALKIWSCVVKEDPNQYFSWINFKETRDIDKIFLGRFIRYKQKEIKKEIKEKYF